MHKASWRPGKRPTELDEGDSSSGKCKLSCSKAGQGRKVVYGDGPDSGDLGVKNEVPAGQADKVRGHAAMLLQEFKWTKYSAVAVQAKLNSHTVVAIVDTSSVGVVISKSCFDRLGMVKDEEMEFTSTTDTNKKVRTVLFGVDITVGEKTVKVPAIVLEGLHFDVLLGVSWMQEAKASVFITEGVLEVDGKRLLYKSWP